MSATDTHCVPRRPAYVVASRVKSVRKRPTAYQVTIVIMTTPGARRRRPNHRMNGNSRLTDTRSYSAV